MSCSRPLTHQEREPILSARFLAARRRDRTVAAPMNTTIVPYLNFPDGLCDEAMSFYARTLGAETVMRMTFGDSPMPCDDAHKSWLMHITIKAPALTLMASDCPPGQPYVRGTNVTLSLNFVDAAEQDRVWAGLGEGAKILMPLGEQFWGARFGMLEDRFGTLWMVNFEAPKG